MGSTRIGARVRAPMPTNQEERDESMSRVRLAVVGCGAMFNTHAQGLKQLLDRVEITYAVDAVDDRAQKAAAQFPGTKAATDYRQVLDEVDAVMLVLPYHLHHPVAKACLGAGKHVLLEKPMANSKAECLDLIETAERSGQVFMIAYCMRFHPLVLAMKKLLDERAYGDVFQVSIWTEQLTIRPPDHWSHLPSTGGGQLFTHGCHYIDILLWLLGRPLRGTHIGTEFGTPWMSREGTSNVCLEFEGGRLAYHFGTWGARGTRLGYAFHAHCTDGMIEADIRHSRLVVHRRGQQIVLVESAAGKQTENEMHHFLECIETGRRPLTDGPGSLQGLRVIWRLYEAERQQTVADLRGLGLDEYQR